MVEEWKAQVEAMSEEGGAGCPGLWKAAVGGDRSSIGHEALGNVAKIFRRPICAPWFSLRKLIDCFSKSPVTV